MMKRMIILGYSLSNKRYIQFNFIHFTLYIHPIFLQGYVRYICKLLQSKVILLAQGLDKNSTAQTLEKSGRETKKMKWKKRQKPENKY